MSRFICFVRRRSLLNKGSSLLTLVMVVFAIINYNVWNSAPIDTPVEDLVKRTDPDLTTDPVQPWVDTYDSPCYGTPPNLFCGPAVYLMGIQYAGVRLLKLALGLHPDIDCYATGFFSGFNDMTVLNSEDMGDYVDLFDSSAEKIQNGADDLCICDSGSDLARTYHLNTTTSVLLPPDYTSSDAIAQFYNNMKVIVVLRDPTRRFVREFCDLKISDPFENVVDAAIAGFENCENDVNQDIASCVYDNSLSGLLQAGLYDFLIEEDLTRSFGIDAYRIIVWDQLENTDLRRCIMESIFNYLGKDIPDPTAPFWTALDALFNYPVNNCNGKAIPKSALEKLDDFYGARATLYTEAC